MARTLLIDTYSVLFRAHHAPPPMNTRAGLPTAALYGTSSLLLKLLREERPRAMAFALDAPRAIFRHERFEAHKATRKPLPDPLRAQLSRLPELLDAFGSEPNMNNPAAVTPAVGRSPRHSLPNSDAGRPREPDATANQTYAR